MLRIAAASISRELTLPRMTLNPTGKHQATVRKIYRRLSRAWGPQHWWPSETPLEVIAGAILTQNTSWTNVERALEKLSKANVLNVDGIRDLPLAELEQLVRSSGYYRQKAGRLKLFVSFLDEKYGGSLEKMFAASTEVLRTELLSLKGIGHETADAILLYAAKHAIFVVDAYARRIFGRHGLLHQAAKYDEVRTLVENALRAELPVQVAKSSRKSTAPQSMVIHEPSAMSRLQGSSQSQVYNEMHGLLVQVGKHYCHKRQPDCGNCPLGNVLPINIEERTA
jgi:endonuclease III related protein